MNILVLGIGQPMRGDDAAGLRAVRLWQQTYLETAQKVKVKLFDLPGLGLLDELKGIDAAVLVDALHTAAAPGTLQRLSPDDLAAFTVDAQSAHGWGVAETLSLGCSLYPWLARCRITLIGIVGSRFELWTEPDQAVQAALPGAAAMIEAEVLGWLES